MASEQIMSKAIGRAVAEATRIALQTMVEGRAERKHDGFSLSLSISLCLSLSIYI